MDSTVTFRFGTLTLRCAATRGSVLRMARKFSRVPDGLGIAGRNILPNRATLHRPKNADSVLSQLEKELADEH